MKIADTKYLIEMRKQAEKAVGDMPDGPLKTKAFEMFLGRLLDLESGASPRTESAMRREAKQARKKGEQEDDKSAAGRILRLREEGFFSQLKSIGEIRQQLAAYGWHYPVTSLSGPLQVLVQRRALRRLKSKDGNKTIWKYSEP